MKYLLLTVIIFNQLLSQDTLFTENGIILGQLLEIKKETIKFWPEPLPGKIISKPKEYSKKEIIRVVDDGKEVFIAVSQDSLICENNRNISIVVVPIKDDYYGITDDLLKSYEELCFNIISNLKSLQFLEKNSIKLEDVNDLHLIEIGKALGVDRVIYGYTYTVNKSMYYRSTGIANDLPLTNSFNNLNDILDFLPNVIYMAGEEKMRRNAMEEAGVYILLTLFEIDVKTQNKSYLLKNYSIMKF